MLTATEVHDQIEIAIAKTGVSEEPPPPRLLCSCTTCESGIPCHRPPTRNAKCSNPLLLDARSDLLCVSDHCQNRLCLSGEIRRSGSQRPTAMKRDADSQALELWNFSPPSNNRKKQARAQKDVAVPVASSLPAPGDRQVAVHLGSNDIAAFAPCCVPRYLLRGSVLC
jgi:hypothetical protein